MYIIIVRNNYNKTGFHQMKKSKNYRLASRTEIIFDSNSVLLVTIGNAFLLVFRYRECGQYMIAKYK